MKDYKFTFEVDEKKFGQLIQEEIDRINAAKGNQIAEATD